jgi:hypothetical protein
LIGVVETISASTEPASTEASWFGIAEQNQHSIRAQRFQQLAHHRQIHHRRLIDHDDIFGQGIVGAVLKCCPSADSRAGDAACAHRHVEWPAAVPRKGLSSVVAPEITAARPCPWQSPAPVAAPPCRWVPPARSKAACGQAAFFGVPEQHQQHAQHGGRLAGAWAAGEYEESAPGTAATAARCQSSAPDGLSLNRVDSRSIGHVFAAIGNGAAHNVAGWMRPASTRAASCARNKSDALSIEHEGRKPLAIANPVVLAQQCHRVCVEAGTGVWIDQPCARMALAFSVLARGRRAASRLEPVRASTHCARV